MFFEEVVISTRQNVFTQFDKKKIPLDPWFNWIFLFE